MVSDYISELELVQMQEGASGLERAANERRQRQLNFLKRKRDITAKDIKPRKRFRRAAFQWLLALENQVDDANGVARVRIAHAKQTLAFSKW